MSVDQGFSTHFSIVKTDSFLLHSIVWGPALVLYSLGAGLASLATVDGKDVWIGLIVWLSTATAIGVLTPLPSFDWILTMSSQSHSASLASSSPFSEFGP